MDEIIIEEKDEFQYIYVLEKGKIVEYYKFILEENNAGNIYLGSVREILNGMQAAFVDIGRDKKALLPLKDALPKIDIAKENSNFNCSISDVLKVGDIVLAQIRKEEEGKKGARISEHITLGGKYVVLMPDTDIITVSQKIKDEEYKLKLKQQLKELLPDGFGCIARTESQNANFEDLKNELGSLIKKWDEICKKYEELKANNNITREEKLIYNDNTIETRVIRDMIKSSTQKIYVNTKKIFEKIKDLECSAEIVFKENVDFIKEFGLETELEKISDRKIWLPCGGEIVIDKTEALTAIDVNTGKCIGKEDFEETKFKVNKEAAKEIMKQIRLRDIGGIIIIDYVDMISDEHKDEILSIMKKEQFKDRSKIDIKDFTKLNLVELTRKKLYK